LSKERWVLILAGIAAIVVALGIRLFKGSGDRATKAEDARVIQEIYQGLPARKAN